MAGLWGRDVQLESTWTGCLELIGGVFLIIATQSSHGRLCGCPFSCEFCEIIAFMGRRVVARDIIAAVDDLESATTALGANQVFALDDTFTINRRRVLALCEEIVRRRLRVSFEIFSRADTIDREMMQVLSAAGCTRVFFGVDGGDDGVLTLIDKRLEIERAERTLFEAAEWFQVTASFIWGYPFESYSAFGVCSILPIDFGLIPGALLFGRSCTCCRRPPARRYLRNSARRLNWILAWRLSRWAACCVRMSSGHHFRRLWRSFRSIRILLPLSIVTGLRCSSEKWPKSRRSIVPLTYHSVIS